MGALVMDTLIFHFDFHLIEKKTHLLVFDLLKSLKQKNIILMEGIDGEAKRK